MRRCSACLTFICKVLVDSQSVNHYFTHVIEGTRHKGLLELLETGKSRRVRQDQVKRILLILSALEAAMKPEDMNLPGLRFHSLHGHPQRYAVSVNGPWRITFAWNGENATDLDFEQYH